MAWPQGTFVLMAGEDGEGWQRDGDEQCLHGGLRSTSSEDHRPTVVRTEWSGWEASQGA